MQADILDGGPHHGQATGLGREHINLIRTLLDITKQAFNGIGRLNVPMHTLRKRVKRERLLFLLSQASYCLWIALTVFGFEGHPLCQCLLLGWLLPDTHKFGLNLTSLSPGNGIQDSALFVRPSSEDSG